MKFSFIILLILSFFVIRPSHIVFADEDFNEGEKIDEFNTEDFEDNFGNPEDLERELIDDGDLERELINPDEQNIDTEFNDVEENEDQEEDIEDDPIDEENEDLEGDDTEDDPINEENEDLEGDDTEYDPVDEEKNAEAFENEAQEFTEDQEEDGTEGDLSDEGDEGSSAEDSLSDEDSEDSFADEEGVSFEATNIVKNISYLADKDEIHIEGSNTISHQSKRNEENSQLIIEILESRIAKDLKWPYILKDFNTGFGLIKADQKDEDTVRVLIQLKKEVPFPSITTDETSQKLIIYFPKGSSSYKSEELKKDVLPVRTLEELYFGDISFTGNPISFHVVDAPVRQVLRFISEESGLNLVIGEGVTGLVTLKLESVPWDQALYTVLKVKDLGYTREGNIITISPLAKIEERTKKLREIVSQQKHLAPFKTKNISVSYSQLSDIKSKVEGFLTKEKKATGQEAGKVVIHEESSTIIIIDTEEVIKKIETIVAHLDKTPQQVMVEARIVEAEETLARDFGLQWGLSGNLLPVTVIPTGIQNTTASYSGSYVSGAGQMNLNLSGIPIIGDLGASLNIAESNGYARVVSSPKIVTISGKKASITRNSPIQIRDTQSTTQNNQGGQTTQETFKTVDVKISLEVTPVVTSAQTVFLNVNISRSNPGAGRTVQTTRAAQTEVLVKNGHTIVIGGIYQYDQGHGRRGIPFFKNIPVLKYLFDRKESSSAKNELLVFLTPKIINNVNE